MPFHILRPIYRGSGYVEAALEAAETAATGMCVAGLDANIAELDTSKAQHIQYNIIPHNTHGYD